MERFKNNSVNKDFMPVSVQDPVNPAELMVIFCKEKSLNSMLKKSNHQERNDLLTSYPLSSSLFFKFFNLIYYFTQQHRFLCFGFYLFSQIRITFLSVLSFFQGVYPEFFGDSLWICSTWPFSSHCYLLYLLYLFGLLFVASPIFLLYFYLSYQFFSSTSSICNG